MASTLKDPRNLNELFGKKLGDLKSEKINAPRGAQDSNVESLLNNGEHYVSPIQKMHIIKLVDNFPALESNIKNNNGFFTAKSAIDLCTMADGAVTYDIEDFLYCKYIGVPINRLITLRRFPTPCVDNIYDTVGVIKIGDQSPTRITETPDIARMVTYMTNDTNKMEDILSFSYGLKWKELTADFEQATMFGEQSGVSGFIKKIAAVMDSTTNSNYLSGRATNGPMSSYDPKFDQNRVYGPVDSIASTNIRDVGLEFNKEFEIVFDYELRSINGRTPEFAMKDLIGNIMACTFNNGKFWGGARYWVGERPSPWASKLQWMNSDNFDDVMRGMMTTIKTTIKERFGNAQSSLQTLKNILKGGFAMAISKILDGLGRPGIPAMNSLLSADPTGCWHLMIGNPTNPIMCIGNLCLTGADIKFPTDSLSYGDFPTKLQVIVKLKPGQPRDRAGIERMFNKGKMVLFHNPKNIYFTKNSKEPYRQGTRNVYGGSNSDTKNSESSSKPGFSPLDLQRLANEAIDFREAEMTGDKITSIKDQQIVDFNGNIPKFEKVYENFEIEKTENDKVNQVLDKNEIKHGKW